MTIGIGAFGPRAGHAVFAALRAAEAVARGAIGGFVTYAAITRNGELRRYQTQRGGTATLFTVGETTGVEPPSDVAEAAVAALMSSGPDRPEPLSQFVAADARIGLVTGHRFSNGKGVDGKPINLEVLAAMQGGASARDAVDAVLGRNPESDAGVLAVDVSGGVYARNSQRVRRRRDLGWARREIEGGGAVVEVLHNAIRPFPVVAELAAAVAIGEMGGEPEPAGWLTIGAGVPVVLGAENAVIVDDDLVAVEVVTTDPLIVGGRHNCAAVYIASAVKRNGETLGRTMFEPNVNVEDGRIVSLSGQTRVRVGFGR